MADLIIRLINKSEAVYIDYYDIHSFTIIEDGEGWWVNWWHKDNVGELVSTHLEKFGLKEEAERALDNICRALTLERKYVTLLPDGNIEMA